MISLGVLASAGLEAQTRFQLKRTKRESIPISVQLYGGYNGISDPAEILQDEFINQHDQSWGGVIIGLQCFVALDSVGLPFWIGGEIYFNRVASHNMRNFPGTIFYKSDRSPVDALETVFGYGGTLLIQIDLLRRFALQVGGGYVYLVGQSDVPSEVIGLFPSTWTPTVVAGINFEMLKYAHGSIDANLRAMQCFGIYNNFLFQSLLGFTFDF